MHVKSENILQFMQMLEEKILQRAERRKSSKNLLPVCLIIILFSKRSYLFLERLEGERGEEKHQGVVALHTPPRGDSARNPGLCPD